MLTMSLRQILFGPPLCRRSAFLPLDASAQIEGLDFVHEPPAPSFDFDREAAGRGFHGVVPTLRH
jgi:hypothetical protein